MAAKEKVESTPETPAEPKSTKKRPPAKPVVNDNKARVQEAKDLKSLVESMNKKNSPETSKDITAFAKDTLKLVAKAQKSESAAFRREATKTLIEFRKFVEQTDKLNEQRRSKLLSDIDNVALDAKNASFMLLSVAKTQAENIKLAASKEAHARKIAAQENEKRIADEAKQKAKKIEEEAKLKSVALKKEQEERIKALSQERTLQYQKQLADIQERTAKQKEANDKRKQSHKEQVEADKKKAEEDKAKLKKLKEDAKLDIEKRKNDMAVVKSKHRNHVKNLKEQLKQSHDTRRNALEQEKLKHRADIAQQKIDLKDKRAQSAATVKKLKSDLRDNFQKKKADLAQRKIDLLQKNKDRIQKIREMTAEHKVKLKKITDEAKAEALLKKHAFKKRQQEEDRAEAKRSKNREEFTGKIRQGIYEANPLLHAAAEIAAGMGLHDYVSGKLRKHKEKREEKKLNKLNHTQAHATPAAAGANPSPAPNPSGSGAPTPPSSSQGGPFSGILGMLPSVSGILSGIGSLFSGIVGAFGKVGSLLMGGARFLPVIGTVAAVVGGIWKFIEGFNDASSLFGEKIADNDYVTRVYSGFTNVVGSILGLFDKVAGWLGFDTNLEGSFKKSAVKVFAAIINTFKSLAGGLANLLEYIPGMGGVAKSLKDYSKSDTPGEALTAPEGGAAKALTAKTKSVNDLKDEVESKKVRAGAVQVVTDNSVKQTSTTIVQPKMDTRNNDRSVQLYQGAGATARW